MNILTQNGKMKKSSQNGIDIFNFGIPAFQSKTGLQTCPNARQCAVGCYARSGTYRFRNVVNTYEERLKLTQDPNFVNILNAEVNLKLIHSQSKNRTCLIRIHDSGDFYSKDYAMSWIEIIKSNPLVQFYAYTKMVQLWETIQDENFRPKNFRLIYSYGGKQDSQIDTDRHFHSKVFQTETDLLAAGYADASNNDLVAALGTSRRIGLVYHGVKGYHKTAWHKVG